VNSVRKGPAGCYRCPELSLPTDVTRWMHAAGARSAHAVFIEHSADTDAAWVYNPLQAFWQKSLRRPLPKRISCISTKILAYDIQHSTNPNY